MGFNIDITDAQLDKIGNYTDKFLKGGVLFASIMGMAGFLGLIFVTISPAPLSPEHVHEADPTAVGDLAPIAPDTPAAWITEFSDVPGSQTGECFETRTGIYAVCVPSLSGTALMVYQSPLSGDMWPTWKCEPCDGAGMCDGAKCPTAPVFECNATVLAEGCACSPGCVCGEHARKCEAQPPTKKTEVARVADLSGETKFFSVLSNAGYLFFMLLILLAELDIERFKHVFKFAAYWPARVLFQLFSGAQLINASTTLEIGGRGNGFVHFLSLGSGWLLVFASLVLVSFNLCYSRSWRVFKLCGLFLMVVVLVICIIGISFGTVDDSSSAAA